ncbi:dihydroorotate dehydrogenase electron transfer subunit [Methanocaldococcus indicus]|uniref:dihydroorotate dehydrogenase electron transfer subunit n=1 Tax=Methanocaldococcus indicus TaxID=213231 RepID=UPI003C6D2269
MICKIKKIIDENERVKTFVIDKKFNFKPGQFAMLWIPGVDEKPFSFLSEDSFTIAKVGPFTEKLFSLKEGDIIGVRGPYGSYFKPYGDKILAVAGGIGAVPIMSFVEFYKDLDITVILGARTKKELLFLDRFEKYANLVVCTDDGSYGYKGFTTDKMEDILKNEKFDLVITCGPEVMMKKVFEISLKYNIPIQASLERYMKCGIGICGHCCIDEFTVCKEGPVFSGEQLKLMKEFGKFKRTNSGKKIYF